MTTSRPRIAICGLHTECSTFTPHIATASDFTVLRGEELLQRYPWITHTDRDWSQAVEWIPILHARAVPGGPVEAKDYYSWRDEICEKLAEANTTKALDGIYFDIHGAMNVIGLDDAEGDLITAIRNTVGSDIFVGCTMDLHGNVSTTLFHGCDQLTCFRLAPHEDTWETRERGARNLCHALLFDAAKPHKALVHVPILLPGEMTSTRLEPAKSLYGSIPEIETLDGITDAAIWIGYAWADEPRSTAAIVVYGDNAPLVEENALELAQQLWSVRHEFEFVAPAAQFADCLDKALSASPDQHPFIISDSGDNPGAGGADDCTFTLDALMHSEAVNHPSVLASIVDPAAVHAASNAGVGASISIPVGGHIDTTPPGTVTVSGIVGALADDPTGGICARIDVGTLQVIITSRRTQYATLDMYRRLGIEPEEKEIICVKIGYLEPELHAIAKGWMLALTPGGVDQDLIRLGHHRITRPMFPFDPDMDEPEWVVVTNKDA
ncbi:hypothetical protein CMUST_04110 [Corynebacterium mustelae]|uniref:Microcystin degradation protein MlrC n=1 Tax=Corynebacterium mustelae TaxID=571915 RepID=A0A0G3GXC6_9CORY|nr:M81 family metallopeptidase [Corynebacterium mustelae]AKK05165.1 hypothetical protein CMUST_04110 [Corynebacterium mustelae]